MVNIKKLKEYGFFNMSSNEQTEFLRKHKFFNLSNENKIKFFRRNWIILFRYK